MWGRLLLLVAGREVCLRVKWVLLFLFLMVPRPGQIHNLIAGPLQSQASIGAAIVLELLGVGVTRNGNVLQLPESVPLAIAEACSGLRMLTAFVVVAAAMAFVVQRPPWQRAVLVLSSVPVAIVCNLARVVTTALLFMKSSNETAELFFHDFAGFSMMPLAILILRGELWVMARLVVHDDDSTGRAGTLAQPGTPQG